MKRLLLLTAISLIGCDQDIPFEIQGSNNVYLGCSKTENSRNWWRNVILDKTNKSVKSEWFFVTRNDYTIVQTGTVFALTDNYDKTSYQWGEHTRDVFSDEFTLHKTTLNLELFQKSNVPNMKTSYSTDKFRCNVYDDYQAYSKWERDILERLKNNATKLKAEAKSAESAKRI